MYEGKGKPMVLSAFLIEYAGEWFLATAGHIVRDLMIAKRRGQITKDMALCDAKAFLSHPETYSLIPFTFDGAEWSYVCDEEFGVDVGLVYLRPHYRELLKAGGMEPWAAGASAGVRNPDAQEHWMMGIPGSSVELVGSELKHVTFEQQWVRLTETLPPENLRPPTMFFGQLAEDAPEQEVSIDGFSGSPIVAVKRNAQGNIDYMLAAMQHGACSETQLVIGTSADDLGRLLVLFFLGLCKSGVISSHANFIGEDGKMTNEWHSFRKRIEAELAAKFGNDASAPRFDLFPKADNESWWNHPALGIDHDEERLYKPRSAE